MAPESDLRDEREPDVDGDDERERSNDGSSVQSSEGTNEPPGGGIGMVCRKVYSRTRGWESGLLDTVT